MTILAHDDTTFSKSFPTTQSRTWSLDPEFIAVGLFSLLGLSITALALVSGAAADFEAIAPFLG